MRGRRAAMAAGVGVVAVLLGAWVAREDIAAWYVGYRFHWPPAGLEPWCGMSVNADGEVLVWQRDARLSRGAGVWSLRTGQVTRIEPPPGTKGEARCSALSDSGHVLGQLFDIDGTQREKPFLWSRQSGMQLLPTPDERIALPNDLNSSQHVVGCLMRTLSGSQESLEQRAAVWTPEQGCLVLDGLGGTAWPDSASSINELGCIAGASTAQDGHLHPVLWPPPDRRPRDLGLRPGFDGGAAVDIDDRGAVLVNLWRVDGGKQRFRGTRPFLWTEERGFTELPVPDGYSSVTGLQLNRQGAVLIRAERVMGQWKEVRSFLVRDGIIHELPVPRRGSLYVEYHGLSDRGWLIGTARLRDGPDARRGFVAIPVR